MKHRYFMTALAVLGIATMYAEDRLYVNNFEIKPNETKTIEIVLDNTTEYCALQTDIVLSEGISIDKEDDEYIIDLTSRKGRDHVISANLLASGAIRAFVTSQNSRLFSGNSGAILTMEVTASASFVSGQLKLTNSVVVEEDGSRHPLDDSVARINWSGQGGLNGDVNGDGDIDITDVVGIANYVMGETPGIFNQANADINGNGSVDVSDVVKLANIILGV